MRIIQGGLVAALFIGLAACTTTEGPGEGGVRIDGQNQTTPALNSVRVIDKNLAAYTSSGTRVDTPLDVEGTYVSTTPTGFKKITVQLRNKSKVALPLDVRTSWFDAAGVPTDAAQSWSRVFLQPQAMATYEQSSARLNSAQYYVEIRGAQ